MSRLTSTGVAWSAGALEPKEDWLPAASRMPVALAARGTRKLPTAVFWAPAPSARTRGTLAPEGETEARGPPLGAAASGPVATAPETETEASEPPLGTAASVQGAVPAL